MFVGILVLSLSEHTFFQILFLIRFTITLSLCEIPISKTCIIKALLVDVFTLLALAPWYGISCSSTLSVIGCRRLLNIWLDVLCARRDVSHFSGDFDSLDFVWFFLYSICYAIVDCFNLQRVFHNAQFHSLCLYI